MPEDVRQGLASATDSFGGDNDNIRLDRLPPEGLSRRPTGGIEFFNLAEVAGHIGAGFVPAALGLAYEAGKTGILPLPKVMVCAGEDDGTRLAISGEFTT